MTRFKPLWALALAGLLFRALEAEPPLNRVRLGPDFPGHTYRGPLPSQSSKAQEQVAQQLQADIRMLSQTIGERNLRNAETANKLERAKDWICQRIHNQNFTVQLQTFSVGGRSVHNISWEIPGRTNKILLIGAHYDSAYNCPGADDNASGVAALLGISSQLRAKAAYLAPNCTIRMVAFTNEEPPHFQQPSMGSLVYARQCRTRQDNIVAMYSLETMGYYTNRANTQKYPAFPAESYPTTGNFLTFVAAGEVAGEEKLLLQTVSAFRDKAPFPSEGLMAPSSIAGVGWSDHWSFWQIGAPSIMITDTALFRNPNYHKSSDQSSTISIAALATVTCALSDTFWSMANRLGAR